MIGEHRCESEGSIIITVTHDAPSSHHDRMIDARTRGLLMSILLGQGLQNTPVGQRIVDAFETAMNSAVLPLIVTAEEAAALRERPVTTSRPKKIRPVREALAEQLGATASTRTSVVRLPVGVLRRLWLNHIGLFEGQSLTICRVVERSGALQVGVLTRIADEDVDTIARALPAQESRMFQTLLGDRPVDVTD
ncbi:hypothetical protein [Curtobacterium pusillum]|uniref:hypothetical protein n=1 Tax=Curtobacterium pusillum TaxID=69373 RepID=UPI0011A36503|nr:hypothetical protein [Curtobacterium pusillum]